MCQIIVTETQNAAANASRRISAMKQQFVASHQYSALQQTEETSQLYDIAAFKQVMFLRNYKDQLQYFVCGQNVLTEGVFVTQLSSNFDELCGMRQNRCFMSETSERFRLS